MELSMSFVCVCVCGRYFLTYPTLILLLYVYSISRYEMFFEIMIFKEFSLDFTHLSNTCLQWIERIQIVQGEMLTMDIFTLMGKESVSLEPDFESNGIFDNSCNIGHLVDLVLYCIK